MKITKEIIRITCKQFRGVCPKIGIAKHTIQGNTVELEYDYELKTYTIIHDGQNYSVKSAEKAIEQFYKSLYQLN